MAKKKPAPKKPAKKPVPRKRASRSQGKGSDLKKKIGRMKGTQKRKNLKRGTKAKTAKELARLQRELSRRKDRSAEKGSSRGKTSVGGKKTPKTSKTRVKSGKGASKRVATRARVVKGKRAKRKK